MSALIEIAVSRQNDVLLITKVDGGRDKIVYANAAIRKHTGYAPEEVIGNCPRMFQGEGTSRETLAQIRAAVDSHQPIRTELLNYRKDGTPYWTEINISPIFDSQSKATHMVAVQRDITEQKAARDAVQRLDSRFRLALEASANAIWEWNIQSDATEFSDDMPGRSWHGRHHGTLQGQGLEHFLSLIHPDDRKCVGDTLRAKCQGSDHLIIAEYRLRRPDGSYADINDRQFILRAEDGTAERVIGSILDISEKRELSDRRSQIDRLELLGQMTGGVAHNFNNLLTVILGSLDRLRDSDMDHETSMDTIRMIDDAARRGAKLVEHLMSFSQVETLDLQATDLRVLTESIAPIWRNLLPPEIRLDVHQADDLWHVRTDALQLEAAILNLIMNARDAMPTGGQLTITLENLEASSNVVRTKEGEAPAPYVVISVTDSGMGMSAEHLKVAFQPFFTTKPPGKGTGLGLSSAHGFLQKSGGFLRLSSTLGQGTTASIFLPVADKLPVQKVKQSRRRPVKDGGHHVLVVDDDALVRDYVQALLTSLRYQITVASNGAEALAILAADSSVDLLFTDIVMDSGMNGWELAEQAHAAYPDLPILFTSAYPDTADAPPDIQAASKYILRKPYRARDLSVAIVDAIAGAEAPTGDT